MKYVLKCSYYLRIFGHLSARHHYESGPHCNSHLHSDNDIYPNIRLTDHCQPTQSLLFFNHYGFAQPIFQLAYIRGHTLSHQ